MSVYKRGTVWYVAIETGRDENGKRRKDYHSGFRTKKEAHSFEAEKRTELARGAYVSASRQTVKGFVEEWLPTIKLSVRRSTWDSYEGAVRDHIVPRIGHHALQALTPTHVNGLYAELLERGRTDGRGGLSPKTVRNIHVVLRKALGDAVRWGLLSRNVAELADPPRLRSSARKGMSTWSAAELRAFLAQVNDDRLYAAWHVSASTGMRRGEVLGLRWLDVDLDTARLTVRQAIISVNYVVHVEEPKTAIGRRVIDLDAYTVAVLRAHRTRQLEERLSWGPAYEDSGLVFTREDGALIHPDRFSQMFDLHVSHSGQPRIRLHDLRHTWATLALKAGVHPKVVSERLGHATVAFTLDVYSHVTPGMQADAAERVAALIFGEPT